MPHDVSIFDVLTHPLFLASAVVALALLGAAYIVLRWTAPATQMQPRLPHAPRHALPAAPVADEPTTILPVVEHVGATEEYAAELIELRDAPPSDAFFEADLDAQFAALIASWREEPDWLTTFRAGTDQRFIEAGTAAGEAGIADPLVDTCEIRADEIQRMVAEAEAGASR